LNSPTLTARATEIGVILGTAAYMAPEQARGRAVDKRADIWAFGIVLFEMLSGRRLFDGEEISDVMASILRQEIDWSRLPSGTPASIRRLLQRCLERDPKRRLRDIGEARVALDTPHDEPAVPVALAGSAAGSIAAMRPARSTRLLWAIAIGATLIAIALAAALVMRRPAAPSDPALLLEIGPPPDQEFLVGSNTGAVIISPDGSTVAFLTQTSEGRRLNVRSLATGETRALPGTAEAHYPFWSPDSRSIGFFGSGKLFTIAVAGGSPEAITDINQGRGGTWSDAGDILFTPVGGGVVHRVPEGGGASAPVTTLDASRGENAHYWPVALPGGRKFLFFIRSTRPENNGIYLGSLDGAKPVRLVTSLSSGLYAPARGDRPGHLLWVRDDDLFAQPLDIDSGRLTGEVKSVASDVRVEESQRGTFASVSDAGRLVWASARGGDFNFSWYERNGHRLGDLPIATGKIMQPRISPDGRKLAFTRAVGGTADIWVHDLASAATTQVTTDPDYDENPSWSPDGRRLIYQGRPDDTLLVATLDGSSPILKVPGGSQLTGGGFMPDGRTIMFSRITASTTNDLAVAHLDRPDAIVALTNEPGQEFLPTPSPDGRWLAFVTDRTGRPEVVIARLFSDGTTFRLGQRLPVSPSGGFDPTWRKDGREIIYLAPDATLMSVAVTVDGEAVTLGKPTALFKVPADAGGWGSNWAGTADLTKFVVAQAPQATRQQFRLLTDWMAGK
jgi:eukaryotic-like serine/threonine-protein kinase